MEETSQIIYSQLEKIKQMKEQNLNINNPLECYLINNDMIKEISTKHYTSSLNSDNKNFNNIRINIGLLLTENLKINDIDYPCNFFIIEKENFKKLVNENNILNEFKLYKVLIGKNGIFIINEEMDKDRYIVYYIYNMDLNDCKIDKIFIFKKQAEFQKEIELLNNKGRDDYFNSRNIINDKTGYYNLIDDGKIIGKYINLKRIDTFQIKSRNKEEENNNKNNNKNYNGDNNDYKIIDNNEDYKERIGDNNENINKNDNKNEVNNENYNEYIEEDGVQKKIENDLKKKEIIKLFLPHLLVCLTKIDLLKSYLIQNLKSNPNLSKYKLMQLFSEILEKNIDNEIFEGNNNELIDDFINEFFTQNLHEKFDLDKDNILSNYENMIKILINKLREDLVGLFVNSNRNVLSFFENVFYGKKNIENNNSEGDNFNTLYIDPNDYCGNETHVSLETIINKFQFKEKEKIKLFPNIMIIITFNQYENFLTVPLNLNIKELKINYNLLCSISSDEQHLVSFIKNNENKFFKTYFEQKAFKYESLESHNELNNCFIYFYEKEKDKNEECGYYSINSKNNNCINTDNIPNIGSNNNTFNNNNSNIVNNNDNYNNNYFNNLNNNNYNINNKNFNYMNNNNYDLNDMNNNAINNMNNNSNNFILNNMNNNDNFGFNYMNINNNNNLNYTNNFVLNNINQNNRNYMDNNVIPNNNYMNNNNLNLKYMNNKFNNMNNNDLSLNPSKYNYNSMEFISSNNRNNFNSNSIGGGEKCINGICNSMNNIKSNFNYNINAFNNNNIANMNFKTNN